MPFSFAQNFEDVLLWRCFRDKGKGFYVDVGASSPIIDSVTHLFYQQGWSGINLEPLPERFAELSRLRPRDRNLCLAAGATEGTARLTRATGIGGLSTIEDIAVTGVAPYLKGTWVIEAMVRPLSRILDEEKAGEIDFLKIDAEGAEDAVLAGLDLARWRPAVVLVEATLPMSTVPSHATWEPLLVGRGYRFVWFDGLNRFYLADERADLAPNFATPANVHDAMRHFGTLGPALGNRHHPDHGFAVHFASLLLRAPGVETDAYLEAVLRQDRPPELFETQVDADAVTALFRLVFGRPPEPAALTRLLAITPPPSGAELVRRLLASDEFRNRRSRIAGG